MKILPNQTFSAPFCRVRLYRPAGDDLNKMTQSNQLVESWTKEIYRYVDSVEVTTRKAHEGLGDYRITLNAPIETIKAWLDDKDGRGQWLRFGVMIGITFGYSGGEESNEFRGFISFPELDLNPASPTVSLAGPISGNILRESMPSISGGTDSAENIIIKKMSQFGYGKNDVEITSRLKPYLGKDFLDTIPNGQSLAEFLNRTLPKMMIQSMELSGGLKISLKATPYVIANGNKIKFDLSPIKDSAKSPQVVFMFMGKYNLRPLEGAPIIPINSFRLPLKWSNFDDAFQAPSVGGNVTDGKGEVPAQESTKGKQAGTIIIPAREEQQIKSEQSKLDLTKTRYLAVDADVDTIGLPTLDVDDTVLFKNIGELIDGGTWRIFSATHKYSKLAYTSSWRLHCINMEEAFHLQKQGTPGVT